MSNLLFFWFARARSPGKGLQNFGLGYTPFHSASHFSAKPLNSTATASRLSKAEAVVKRICFLFWVEGLKYSSVRSNWNSDESVECMNSRHYGCFNANGLRQKTSINANRPSNRKLLCLCKTRSLIDNGLANSLNRQKENEFYEAL
jgi:hypothetical protein